MKKAILAALVACIGYANAANIVISNVSQGPGDTLYANKDNVRMSSGIVTVGYFNAGFDVNANLGTANWAQLVSNFNILATATPGTASATLGGSFAGYVEANPVAGGTITGADPLLGRMMYTFVGGDATLAASIAGNGIALFEIKPIADDVPFDNTYQADPTGKVIKIGASGTFVGDAGAGAGTYNTLQLVAIPEPSIALLGALGIFGFVRRRR